MKMAIQSFWIEKAGNAADEYEDAFAYRDGHLAVADGATESAFAEEWASKLVEKSVTESWSSLQENQAGLSQWLAPLQRAWSAEVPWQRLPWYAEEKAKSGAFSTLLAVDFKRRQEVRGRPFVRGGASSAPVAWNALAIGDTNLFQIRNDEIVTAFPLQSSKQFHSRPVLLSSNPAHNVDVWKHMVFAQGECRSNDLFIFATDALAQWFLNSFEKQEKPWRQIANFNSNPEFKKFFANKRSEGAVRNDDMTLLLFRS